VCPDAWKWASGRPSTQRNVTLPSSKQGSSKFSDPFFRTLLDRPLIDKTGLSGTYEYSFDMRKLEDARAAGRTNPAVLADAWLAAIQEQLGLKVEAKKAATDILVIDRADRPSEN